MDDDSDSGSDFGGFASDDLGGNQHVAATLGTGSDIELSDWDVNGGSSSSSDSDGDGGDGGNASLTWTSATTDVVVDPFLPQQVGPAILLGPQAKPVDYFLAMFGLTTFVVMAKQTNLYAKQVQEKAGKRDDLWTPTPEDGKEMRAFFAMNIMMGIISLPSYDMYWKADSRLNQSSVSSVMTKRRYEKLSQYIHLADNSAMPAPNSPDYDPLYKVRPLLDTCERTFRTHYVPHKELSVDEAMVGFKGRLSWLQYMPAKPTKWGMKVWQCCDSTNGYCCTFQVYTGKEKQVRERGLGHHVVIDLVRPYFGRGYHVYFDNFFTSVPLVRELAQHRTLACGTVRMNRKELPADVKKTKLKVPGDLLTRQSGNLLLTMWHDKRQVAVLSTNQNAGSIDITRRNGSVVSKPTAIANYNKHMGGVDLCDQNMSYYPAGRESKKWWKYLLWNFFNLSIVNAYVLYTENVLTYTLPKRYTQLDFRLALEDQLRDGFSSRTSRLGRTPKRTIAVNEENVGGHICVRIEGRKRQCVQCASTGQRTPRGGKRETVYMCTVCNVALCRVGCHRNYHAIAN